MERETVFVAYILYGHYDEKDQAIVYAGTDKDIALFKLKSTLFVDRRYGYIETWFDGQLDQTEEFEF